MPAKPKVYLATLAAVRYARVTSPELFAAGGIEPHVGSAEISRNQEAGRAMLVELHAQQAVACRQAAEGRRRQRLYWPAPWHLEAQLKAAGVDESGASSRPGFPPDRGIRRRDKALAALGNRGGLRLGRLGHFGGDLAEARAAMTPPAASMAWNLAQAALASRR